MATVTHLGTAFDTNAGPKTVTATPAAGDAIVIVCANTGRTISQRPTVIDNNGDDIFLVSDIRPVAAPGVVPVPYRRAVITSHRRRGELRAAHPTVAYERVSRCDAVKNASADSMWIFIRNRIITANQETIFTMTQSGDTGGGLAVFSVTDLEVVGQGAARGGGQQSNQSAATPAPVLTTRVGGATQAALTTNPCIGAVFNATSPAGLTEPSGWTEGSDAGYSTPTAGLETAFRSSGETGSTITWGSASASAFCSIVLELYADVPPPGFPGFEGKSQTMKGHFNLGLGLS